MSVSEKFLVFWCLQEVSKWNIGMKLANQNYSSSKHHVGDVDDSLRKANICQ